MSEFTPLGKIKETLVMLVPMMICVLGIIMTTNVQASGSGKTASADTAIDEKPAKEKKMKCRSIKTVGTNIAKKVCDTKENWKTLEKRNRYGVDEYTREAREKAGIVTQPSSVEQGASAGALGGP